VAARRLSKPIDLTEPEARALADLFGGEERIKCSRKLYLPKSPDRPIMPEAGTEIASLRPANGHETMLISFLRSDRSPLKLRITPLNGRHFKDILGVGFPSAIGTVQVNLTVAFVTAAVGRFGADAIAGYGIASRLDYLQIPLLLGLGTAVVTMVGVNVGADQMARVRRIAWIGTAKAGTRCDGIFSW
jgi:hypothetical protein